MKNRTNRIWSLVSYDVEDKMSYACNWNWRVWLDWLGLTLEQISNEALISSRYHTRVWYLHDFQSAWEDFADFIKRFCRVWYQTRVWCLMISCLHGRICRHYKNFWWQSTAEKTIKSFDKRRRRKQSSFQDSNKCVIIIQNVEDMSRFWAW